MSQNALKVTTFSTSNCEFCYFFSSFLKKAVEKNLYDVKQLIKILTVDLVVQLVQYVKIKTDKLNMFVKVLILKHVDGKSYCILFNPA